MIRDAISVGRINTLHPKIAAEVLAVITAVENSFPKTVKIRIVQALRTQAEQDALFAQGRTKPGPVVTKAKFGQSFHNYGLALDFAIMYDKDNNGTFEALSWNTNFDFDKDAIKDWQEVVKPFLSLGYKWGGNFTSIQDDPHLEKPLGLTWRECFEKYKSKDFIAGTNYINI